MDRNDGDKRLYTLLAEDGDGATFTRLRWLTTEQRATEYAYRFSCSGDVLVGPRGETLIRF